MKKIIHNLLTILQLQLFLNIISLLIIVHWGLPLSYLALIGNIVFSPILTLFLLISSLIFFFELLHIPNELLINFLEFLTQTWTDIMAWADQSFVVNLSKPSLLFTLCATFSTFAILQCRYFASPLRRISFFTCLLIAIFAYLGYAQLPSHDIHTFCLGKKNIHVLYTKGAISIIDQGGMAQHICTPSWIEFTLLPFLRQKYAHDTVSHLIIPLPTIKTFNILNALCTATTVKNVYIPYWQGITPPNLARAYFLMRDSLEKQGKLHRIGKNISLALSSTDSLEILPQKETLNYRTIQVPTLKMTCTVANKNIILPLTRSELRKGVLMEKLSGKKIVLIIASEGYQPTEYNVPKELLRKEGAIIITASDKPGGAVAKDNTMTPVDITLDKIKVQDYDGIFFIGGPGALDCLDNSISYKIIADAKKHNIPYGAICIATRILAKGYGLEGKKATGWDGDGALETILNSFGAIYDKKPIATDGLVVTAQGPDAAQQFAEGITRVVTKKELA